MTAGQHTGGPDPEERREPGVRPAGEEPVGDDALMAAITGEPLPPGAGADAHGEYRSATADVALLRQQLHLLGAALGGTAPRERPAPTPSPTPVSTSTTSTGVTTHAPTGVATHAPTGAPDRAPRRRPFRLVLGVVAAACAGVVVTGLGWLVVQGGSGATRDTAGDSAAASDARPESPPSGPHGGPPGGASEGREAGPVFGTPRYLACARLVAEGTVTAVEPVPGAARHRVTLRVTRAYVPEDRSDGSAVFLLDDALATLAPGDRVLVGGLRDRPTADTLITGERDIATARGRLTASLPQSRTLTCGTPQAH
ncbi:hypothetical protein [Streptomyces sp. enrichment culture]|uniref:hypothetical protein n=1 Tax=Streptomyces sp. enrichment culture TaxID=1795815 RepID=UPI003F54F548